MISNTEVKGLALGNDEEFNRRIYASYREFVERIFYFIRIIYRFPYNCWFCIKSFPSCFKDFFTKRYIAITVLFLSVSCIIFAVMTFIGLQRLLFLTYSLSFFVCSIISLSFKRGAIMFVSFYEQMEQQQQHLIDLQDFEEVDQPTEDFTGDEKERLHRALKNLMKTKSETETTFVKRRTLQVPYDFHHSDSHIPLKCSDYNNAGPSQAPDPFPPLDYNYDTSAVLSHAPESIPLLKQNDTSTTAFKTPDSNPLNTYDTTEISIVSFEDNTDFFILSGDSCDSEELPQRLSEARISADAIKTFGIPLHVLGVDSYKVLEYSDENCTSYEPASSSGSSEKLTAGVEKNTFEDSVQVHHSDSYRPLCSHNDDSSFAVLDSMATDENARMAVSDSHCNFPYADEDQSSEPVSSKHENHDKNS